MGSRSSKKQEEWYIGFIGTADIEAENVKDLLDAFLPNEPNLNIVIPDNIPRAAKGLKNVKAWLKDESLDFSEEPASDVVGYVSHRGNDGPAYLIALWDNDNPDEEAGELIARAINTGVEVKNLFAALDDMVITEEEEPEQPKATGKQRGKPRGDGPTMEIEGPATIIQVDGAANLLQAIRQIIREEVQNMGLSIGHNTFQSDLPEQDVKIKAWYDDQNDTYERAEDGRRAPRGKKTVEISKSEADSLGI